MKKYIISIVSTVLCLMNAYADNITVADVSMSPGETQSVSINLTNTETNLVSFQMDLTLPEGITVNKSGCSLSNRFTDPDQELTIGRQPNGAIRLTSTSFNLTPISGTSGGIITLSLTASVDSEGGTATINNIRFVTSNSERITLADATFDISIASASPVITFADPAVKALCVANWDTNGDDELSEAEAAAVTDLGEVFKGNTTITSFDELQYFTGLTSIQDNAFNGCTNLTSFIIPRNVTSIGGDTFRDCKNLISISVADGNTNYDSRDNCNAIIETATNKLLLGCTNTNIPMGVTCIGVRAFQWCKFTSIDIPNSVSSIEEDAFSWCPNLTSFIIPEGVTTIAPITFYQCTSLTTITIPSSLKNVKTGAFRDCSSLSKVIVPDIAAWCGIIYEGDDWNGDFPLGRAHHLYSDENTEITEVVIPEGVTRIEARAFRDADYVTSVTLPNSLTYIDQQAFRGMSHLTSINLPNGLTSLEHDLFSGCKALPTVTIPGSVTSIGSGAFWGCSSMNSINILDGVRIISQDAFDGCRSLTSITIPKSVTRVGLSVFQGCTSLTSMIVDEENTTYDSRNNCNAIVETATNTLIAGCQNTIIPESVTSIASYAFQGGCTGTTPVLVIPAGMRKIGDYSIDGCTGLTDVWCYATQVPNTSSNAFYASFIQYKTLHVPAASLEAYSTTAPWSDFGTIIAIEEELNTENVDIASAEDLANFASRVNAGEVALSATLKADIDFTAYPNVMIGNNSYYRGEFNGAGHSINLALNRTSEHAALFYRLSGYVHDLTITGTITTSAKYAGGIAGETSNATIERCQSRVNIISTVNGDGTHGGIVGAARPGSIIRDCLISGSITGSQTKCCGGVSGWSEGSVSITNCLITSTFSVSTEDSDKLSRNSSNVISSNNYFQGTWDAANNCTDVTLLTENQVESGEACYLLNNGRTDDDMVWYQTLGVDDCPVPDKRRLAVLFDNGAYVNEQVANIAFADANVKAICVANWDTNGDGELSEAEAAIVTDLGEVFKGNRTITSFNELQYFTGLTSLQDNAFRGCTNLTSFIIPRNVTSIGGDTFRDCKNRASISVAAENTYYDSRDNCNAIIETATNKLLLGCTNTNIPIGVTCIGVRAFQWCSFTSIDIPNSVSTIEEDAFSWCPNLTSFTIPEGVTTIAPLTFYQCNSLTNFTIPNWVTSIEERAFNCCTSLTSIAIPGSVTSIGNYAFSDCTNLTFVTMPDNFIRFGVLAFGAENNIEAVYITNLATWIGTFFGNSNPLRSGAKLYLNNEEVKDLVIPDGTTSIHGAAFEGCESLTSVTIPNSVTSIGGWAFSGCSNLATVIIANSVTSFESYAFRECSSLMDVWCYAEAIPSTGNDLFLSTDIASATLHVPAASLEAYSSTAPWSGFGTIVAIDEVTSGDELYASDITRPNGCKVNIPIILENLNDYAGLQCQITLPEGVSFEKVNRTGRLTDHKLSTDHLGNNTYRVLIYTDSRTHFTGNDGVLFTITVNIADDMENGSYPIAITNIVASDADLNESFLSNSAGILTIDSTIKLGDATNDGRVNVTDILAVANYILEIPMATFNEQAADVNGDGRVNVTDLLGIVNIILPGNSNNGNSAPEMLMNEPQ